MENVRKLTEDLINELNKVVVGYDDAKRKIVLALLTDSHVLLESVPGLAKTLLVQTLQQVVADSHSEAMAFTGDLRPYDLTGTQVFDRATNRYTEIPGPLIGTNFFLADEINRAPAKTQSSLLSAMQERKVKIGNREFKLQDPFLTLATMNPIEQEGTFPLMEAQLDRFAMKLKLDYVGEEDELAILRNLTLGRRDAQKQAQPVTDIATIIAARTAIETDVYTSDALLRYIISLVRATRPGSRQFEEIAGSENGKELKELLSLGASPRAAQALQKLARVQAATQERDYVLPEDVLFVAADVLRHRIILSNDAVFNEKSSDYVVKIILENVPIVDDNSVYRRS